MTHSQPDDVRARWETIAPFWDDYIGRDGNRYHRELVAPAQMRLLELKPGERVLEVACGNGQFAREMAAAGAKVLATDFTEAFLERARAHSQGSGIDYQQLDVTDSSALTALGGGFDAVVATMALMDVADIEPLAAALPGLLRPGGRFVFSTTHPCFNIPGGSRLSLEEEDRNGEILTQSSVRVFRYLSVGRSEGIGIKGQPVAHLYFSRPLHLLLGTFFRHGLVLDGLEEPAFSPGSAPSLNWGGMPEIPPVLAARLRRL